MARRPECIPPPRLSPASLPSPASLLPCSLPPRSVQIHLLTVFSSPCHLFDSMRVWSETIGRFHCLHVPTWPPPSYFHASSASLLLSLSPRSIQIHLLIVSPISCKLIGFVSVLAGLTVKNKVKPSFFMSPLGPLPTAFLLSLPLSSSYPNLPAQFKFSCLPSFFSRMICFG